MEENQSHDSLFGLSIDDEVSAHLYETAKWGKFLAIVGFVFCGLLVLLGIFAATALSSIYSNYDRYGGFRSSASSAFGGLVMMFYVIIGVIYFFPCLFLLRFSTQMKQALTTKDQMLFASSFQNQRRMFRFVGIFTIIILSIYALLFVFGGLSALLR